MDWKIKGNWLNYDYELLDAEGDLIADINKKFFAFTDTFEFHLINEDLYPPLVIAVILAIDYALDAEDS